MRTRGTVALAAMLFLGLTVHAELPSSGFVVWSEGNEHNRTLMLRRIVNGQLQNAQKVCEKGSIGGDIEANISFDGKWVAFARSLGSDPSHNLCGQDDYHSFGTWDIHIVRVDGALPATPKRVGRGYWPTWGDDSNGDTKTLYYSNYQCKCIKKVTVSADGSVSSEQTVSGKITDEWDLHMGPSPDGNKVAYREGGTVYIKWINASDGKSAGHVQRCSGGCHPAWFADSYWLIHANKHVWSINGQHKDYGHVGAYHYGSSADMKWFVTATTCCSGNRQNDGNTTHIYKMSATQSDLHISSSAEATVTQSGSFPDIHAGPAEPPHLGGIEIVPGSKSVDKGAQVQLTAEARDQYGAPFDQLPSPIDWSASGGTLSAAQGAGVTYTAPDAYGEFTVVAQGGGFADTALISVIDPNAIHLRINSGGPDVTGGGHTWESGAPYASDGENFDFGATPSNLGSLQNPAPAAVYSTVLHFDHDYSFPDLPDGRYKVRLHMFDRHPGARSMEYSIEGEQVLSGFDLGSSTDAQIKEFTVDVSDGNGMQIAARAGSGNDVFEAGIEVIALSTAVSSKPAVVRRRAGPPAIEKIGGSMLRVVGAPGSRVVVLGLDGRVVISALVGSTGAAELSLGNRPGIHCVRITDASGAASVSRTVIVP